MLSWLENTFWSIDLSQMSGKKTNKENYKDGFLLKIFFIVVLVREVCYFCTFRVYFIIVRWNHKRWWWAKYGAFSFSLFFRLGIMFGVTNFYTLFHIFVFQKFDLFQQRHIVRIHWAHMAKTTGELFHSAKKKSRKTKKKKVLYDTNSNAFLTIPFLTPCTTPSL